MKKLLNTLYVTTEGAWLARDGEAVAVRIEQETRLRIPIHTLDGIVCIGRVNASPPLMGLCGERQVTLSFLSQSGRFMARVQGPVSGNVLLRREQYRRADDSLAASALARSFVAAKTANARNVLLRAAREREQEDEGTDDLRQAAEKLNRLCIQIEKALPLEALRGREGEAGAIYFGVFDHLITVQKDDFRFEVRSRRPPLDAINALLSFHYTLLAHDVSSALEAVGLDPQVGFLHVSRPGRPALALDMMEALRPALADRLVLSLINRRQLTRKNFHTTESGAVLLDEKGRKEVLMNYQKRKQDEITHPYLGEKIPIGLIPHVQAQLLARHLRGDMDGYPPFFWK